MLAVFEPGALNCYTFFRPIPLNLSVSSNLNSTYLPFSGFLDSLFCVLIAPTPDLAFFLLMSGTLAAASSFPSGRAYPSLNVSPSLFLRLILTLIMQGSSSLLTTLPRCFFLVFTPLLFALFQQIAEPSSFLFQKSLLSGGLQLPSSPLGLKRYFRPPWGERIPLSHLF